ncbi:hypothetical protein, partial [Vibrio alfacsensis]|uniref:hypothetical protein n=1 Tax=Vibrio alfacsensis TaxID=1074311 RepID=UPI004069447A
IVIATYGRFQKRTPLKKAGFVINLKPPKWEVFLYRAFGGVRNTCQSCYIDGAEEAHGARQREIQKVADEKSPD